MRRAAALSSPAGPSCGVRGGRALRPGPILPLHLCWGPVEAAWRSGGIDRAAGSAGGGSVSTLSRSPRRDLRDLTMRTARVQFCSIGCRPQRSRQRCPGRRPVVVYGTSRSVRQRPESSPRAGLGVSGPSRGSSGGTERSCRRGKRSPPACGSRRGWGPRRCRGRL